MGYQNLQTVLKVDITFQSLVALVSLGLSINSINSAKKRERKNPIDRSNSQTVVDKSGRENKWRGEREKNSIHNKARQSIQLQEQQ